ncbi:unnamed protein product, partial [Prunus brigantina]
CSKLVFHTLLPSTMVDTRRTRSKTSMMGPNPPSHDTMVENLLLPQGIAADSASQPPPVVASTSHPPAAPTEVAGTQQQHAAATGATALHGLMAFSSTLQPQALAAGVAA